jgi:hypothetical protein
MRPEGIADTCFCIDIWNGHLLEILIGSRLLWFLDSLENQMSGDHLASALEKVLAGGARLPPDECSARLTKWRSGT